MVSVRRESWRGLPDLRLEQFYTTDTEVLAWRLDVVADLVESEALRGLIRDALPLLRDAAEMRKVLNRPSAAPALPPCGTRWRPAARARTTAP